MASINNLVSICVSLRKWFPRSDFPYFRHGFNISLPYYPSKKFQHCIGFPACPPVGVVSIYRLLLSQLVLFHSAITLDAPNCTNQVLLKSNRCRCEARRQNPPPKFTQVPPDHDADAVYDEEDDNHVALPFEVRQACSSHRNLDLFENRETAMLSI